VGEAQGGEGRDAVAKERGPIVIGRPLALGTLVNVPAAAALALGLVYGAERSPAAPSSHAPAYP
jgi:hypothetical protein